MFKNCFVHFFACKKNRKWVLNHSHLETETQTLDQDGVHQTAQGKSKCAQIRIAAFGWHRPTLGLLRVFLRTVELVPGQGEGNTNSEDQQKAPPSNSREGLSQ